MKRNGFTLIELVMVLTVVFILAAVGPWRISGLRDEAGSVARSDALATVQRMQGLADMEGLLVQKQASQESSWAECTLPFELRRDISASISKPALPTHRWAARRRRRIA